MRQQWSNLRAIANSKVVKSSAIWLILVPLAAKVLESIDEVVTFKIFSQTIRLNTSLPFSWQLLFFAAVFFTLAGIIYAAFCPELVKQYSSYTKFQEDGNSRMQIMHALRKVTWDLRQQIPKEEYLPYLVTYFQTYTKHSEISAEKIKSDSFELFNEVTSNEGKNSNAFYYVHEISNSHTQVRIWIAFAFYMAGFAAIGLIAIQNIAYVLKSIG